MSETCPDCAATSRIVPIPMCDNAWHNDIEPLDDHPAKFSPQILDVIRDVLCEEFNGEGVTVLDPFGGIGGIHELRPHFDTYSIEIEPEWAKASEQRGPTWCGDFFKYQLGVTFTWRNDAHLPQRAIFRAFVTSCTYGNRMADHHDAKETCKACGGVGWYVTGQTMDWPHGDQTQCEKCGGSGVREHKRLTYRHRLGRPLHHNNSGAMQWGDEYRFFHMRAWRKVRNLLDASGGDLFILNVKDHVRRGKIVRVARWHRDVIIDLGFELVRDIKVPVKGMQMGANRELRIPHEHVFVFRRVR